MKKIAVTCLLVLASACSNSVPAAEPVQTTTPAPVAPELTTTSTEAATATTTEPAPVRLTEPATNTQRALATDTTEYLREEATTTVVRRAQSSSAGACGGDLPPCSVMQRESRGSLTVYNYEGSGASGKWQIMPGTWDGYGGYDNAADAPESVQDAKARLLWANGAGCAHWNAC